MIQKTMRVRGALGVLLLLVLLAGFVSVMPASAHAADRNPEKEQVHVVVDNMVYPVSEGAAWDGTLVDTWVDIDKNSTAMSAIVAALGEVSATQKGADSGYISEINGLAAGASEAYSGWMGTLNDWFTNESFSAYTVAAKTLAANDEIHVFFSNDGGVDHGGTWENADTSVKAVAFSAGTLDKTFDKGVYSYTLFVPEDTDSINVIPTASNKNYQVRTYINDTFYKRSASVPVSNGTTFEIICGDPSWPSMNSWSFTSVATTYTFTVVEGPAATLGDINNSKTTNIVDAQIVYDLASGVYGEDYSKLQLPSGWTQATFKWAADVNSDGKIDATDALAIQYYALYGSWGEEQ